MTVLSKQGLMGSMNKARIPRVTFNILNAQTFVLGRIAATNKAKSPNKNTFKVYLDKPTKKQNHMIIFYVTTNTTSSTKWDTTIRSTNISKQIYMHSNQIG